jgi:protein-S-isoprenylcysteine O-methyltransferase Ste14
MHEMQNGYGLWPLVILNSVIFIVFAFSFFRPKSGRDWRAFGGFSAFVVALFTEMYGFPLTIYVLSGWLQSHYPGVNWLSHDAGHLLEELVGYRGNPHLGPFHIASDILIVAGFWLIYAGWGPLYRAQKEHRLAVEGPYAYVRHPQYDGFVITMFGFLLQWPTILTVAMFPVLVFMYWRLALAEEREVTAEFGETYLAYKAVTPAFIPRFSRRAPTHA